MNATATAMPRFRRALVLAALLAAGPARAESVAVLPASGGGVSSALIHAARAQFVASLSRQNGRLRVVDMDRPPTPQPPSPATALLLGYQLGTDGVILLDLRRTGSTTVLRVHGLSLPHGHRLFAFEEATSAGPEVLPAMTERAVLSAMAGERRDPQATLARGPAPAPRTVFLGFRVGGRAPLETAGSTPSVLQAAGLAVVKQQSGFFVDLGFDVAGDDHAYAYGFGLGGYVPFLDAALSPYLGASLRWQWSRFGGQGATGLAVVPALGATWRRPDSISPRLEAGFFYYLYGERAPDRLIPGSGQPHRSYGPEIWLGAWF
jgi:hypothetical protein